MLVKMLYQPGVMATESEESLAVAAMRMKEHGVGSLTVFDEGFLRGIITEADIVTAVAEEIDPSSVPVRDFMTEGVVTVGLETEIDQAAGMMILLGARHMPVIEDGKMVGMLSARDLLHALSEPGQRLDV